jgi:hypothetical protein
LRIHQTTRISHKTKRKTAKAEHVMPTENYGTQDQDQIRAAAAMQPKRMPYPFGSPEADEGDELLPTDFSGAAVSSYSEGGMAQVPTDHTGRNPTRRLPESSASTTQNPTQNRPARVACLEVPQYTVNINDIKFEEDPFNISLQGLLTKAQYAKTIREINLLLKSCRATSLDHALLVSGTGMLPLIPWAIRKKKRSKKRKALMQTAAENFNAEYPELLMRWETKPTKKLLIYRRCEVA